MLPYILPQGLTDEMKSLYMMKNYSGRGPSVWKCRVGDCVYASSRKDLEKHVMRHFGIKPYKCQYCDYRSSEKSGIYRHGRIMHCMEMGQLQ